LQYSSQKETEKKLQEEINNQKITIDDYEKRFSTLDKLVADLNSEKEKKTGYR